jgi:hypothetical protein
VTKFIDQKNYLQAVLDKEFLVGNVPVGPL